jgi:predicted nucleotidyltransferase
LRDCAERLRAYFTTRRPGPVVAAFLFGSQATGRAVPGSDVDVAVVLDPTTRGVDAFSLRVDLSSELVGVLHTNEVDVLILDEAPPLLAARVLREGVCVYCRDGEALREFTRDRLVRAADLLPFLRRYERKLLRALGTSAARPPAEGAI